MDLLYLIFYLLGAICFAITAFTRSRLPENRTWDLIALGLLFWILVPLIIQFQVVLD